MNNTTSSINSSSSSSSNNMKRIRPIPHWLSTIIKLVYNQGGPIRAEYSIKYGAVMVLFFLSGVSIKTTVLKLALSNWKAHLVIQGICFGIVPATGYGVRKLLLATTPLNESLLAGIVIVSCMPTTISSNVMMTAASNGNEGLALINATLSNLIGIALSPTLLELYMGAQTEINVTRILTDLSLMVLGPLLVGQVLRTLFSRWVDKCMKQINFSVVSAVMILLLIYASFANNFAKGTLNIPIGNVFAVIAVLWVLIPVYMGICLCAGILLQFSRSDSVAIVFCGSTKSISLGMALISIIYGDDPKNGLYYLPLLVNYASQLFFGSWAVMPLLKWVGPVDCLPTHESKHDLEGNTPDQYPIHTNYKLRTIEG